MTAAFDASGNCNWTDVARDWDSEPNQPKTTQEGKMQRIVSLLVLSAAWFAAVAPLPVLGCTSWMVFSDLTKNGTNILHKNRDSANRKIVVTLSPEGSPRKWIALGSGDTNSAINSSGLAVCMNSGEKCIDPPKKVKGRKSTARIQLVLLESCDTAAQAVEALKKLIAAGDYSHGSSGSIFFILDAKEGYVCETTATVCSVQRYTCGYTVRASNWQNPGMYEHSRISADIYLRASNRAYCAFSGLNRLLDTHGKITVPDLLAFSRHCTMPKEALLPRTHCGKSTNSSSCMEIDKQYPGVLSTAYVTIGHPRHTVFLPIPVCAEKVLPAMQKLAWSATAFQRLDKLGLEAPLPPEWTKFEADFLARYAQAKDKARKLLAEDKRNDAVRLLNSVAEEIWKEAADLIKKDAKTPRETKNPGGESKTPAT